MSRLKIYIVTVITVVYRNNRFMSDLSAQKNNETTLKTFTVIFAKPDL